MIKWNWPDYATCAGEPATSIPASSAENALAQAA